MGRINKTGDDIQKKLSLSDYKKDIGCMAPGEECKGTLGALNQMETLPIPDSKTARQLASKKKVTFYLDKDTETKLNEVYSRKLMKDEKVDKSSLITKAINLLWNEEKQYEI